MSLPARNSSDCEDRPSTSKFRLALLVVVWAISVAVGLLGLALYANSSGELANPPEQWPEASQLKLHPDHPTVLLFVHPQCFCTRASVRELEAVISRHGSDLAFQVVIVQPSESNRAWRETALVGQLEQLPGVNLRHDIEGKETSLFGVSTSGQVLLYFPDGRLRFNGGVTGSRGHSGDNWGAHTLHEMLSQRGSGSGNIECGVVYGCPLFPLRRSGMQEISP